MYYCRILIYLYILVGDVLFVTPATVQFIIRLVFTLQFSFDLIDFESVNGFPNRKREYMMNKNEMVFFCVPFDGRVRVYNYNVLKYTAQTELERGGCRGRLGTRSGGRDFSDKPTGYNNDKYSQEILGGNNYYYYYYQRK